MLSCFYVYTFIASSLLVTRQANKKDNLEVKEIRKSSSSDRHSWLTPHISFFPLYTDTLCDQQQQQQQQPTTTKGVVVVTRRRRQQVVKKLNKWVSYEALFLAILYAGAFPMSTTRTGLRRETKDDNNVRDRRRRKTHLNADVYWVRR